MASRALLRKQLSQPLESLERRLLLSAADVDDFATSRSAGHLADALPLHHGDPAGAVGRSGVPRLTTGTTVSVRNGSWTSPSTWSNGVPNDNLRAIVSQSTTVTLAGNAVAGQVVVHGTLTVAEQAGVEQTLTTDWVHVNSGGLFRIGSASNRYDQGSFTLTLTGTDANADYAVEMASGMTMQINNNDGFLMAAGGGRLQFFGKEKLTFSKLSQTAAAGSNVIFVENVIERNFDGTTSAASDGSVNWEVGDQIVIASSSRDYADEEVRTITAISNVGNTKRITLDSSLQHRHYGEIETYDNGTREIDMRAEVAVLNRNVKIQGLATQDTDSAWGNRALFNNGTTGNHRGISGHIMIMPTAGQITVDSVQLDRLGQTGTLGRYPIHWHLAGDRTGDVLRGTSVTNSNNRGVTVHGTHNLLIEDNVLHDIHGHGFFMEDAVENGNQYRANITFGIHAVGQVNGNINLADPFIVDTHDHVGQNRTRFLSSAGYWMTNPANIWVGNVSAGSEGTGFWFIFPGRAIGESANDPQYANVQPDRTNLWTFDNNSSHSSPVGLNFDRGSDLEVPVGGQLKANFDGDEHRPAQEPQINNYTAYKHTTGIYHRGRIANFNGTKFADNFTGTFITFTQRITNTLYVGHSRGNANPNDIVTGHTFYDGANTMAGNHFAGYTADNAHMFRAENAAQRLVHFAMSDTSFENDGSAGNVSFVNPSGFSSYNRVGQDMPAVIYDADGTFTGHVGGGAGSTIVPNNPFFYNSIDFRPAGWNAVVSDDLYAMFRMRSFSGNPLFRVTSPDGFSGQNRPGTGQFSGTNTLVKRDDGDYTLDFPEGLGGISNGFEVKYDTLVGPNQGSTIVRVAGVAQTVTINNAPRVQDVATLRNTNGVAFAVAGNDLWVKFSGNIEIDFVPGTNPPIDTPSEDQLVLGASDDAYIENGIGRNTTLLRVETAAGRTRTSYLKFDVPDTPGKDITDALLRLTVTGDPGTNLRLRIYQASNNTWTEAALNPANAPAKTVLLDQITGNWVIGQTYTFDVSDAVVAGEDVSFVIESDGNFSGGDTAFASSENTNVAIRPRLVVELEDAVSTSPVRVNSGAFDYENTQAVRLTFDADVDAADLADAITIRNLTRGTDVPGSEIDTAMNGRTATFTFDNMLANGNYRVTMPAGVALNDAGQMLENAFTMDFFVLAGDLDRDRDVDLTDAALLERNFGRTDDPLFSEGDLDYDGDVDLVDAALLERNFGTQPNSLLVAPPGLFSPVPLSQTRPTDTLFGNADNDQPGGRAFGGRVRDVVR